MANTKVTGLIENTSPAGEDLLLTVDAPSTAPVSRKTTLTNAITKAHGLTDGIVKVATGVMAPATAGTDYYAPGATDVAVADGGTGASDAAGARTNLGLVIGTDVSAAGAVMQTTFNAKGDLLTATADNTPAILTAGTDGHILYADSTAANGIKWAALAAAKQTYNYVVAASGGDYTTLGAALAVMTAGQSVFVRAGTYVETGAVSIATNNLTIVGESGETSIISHSTYSFTLSGTNINLQNIGITSTTGANVFAGNGLKMDWCTIRWSGDPGSGYRNDYTGYYTQISNSKFYDTRTSMTGNGIRIGAYGVFSGNYCEVVQYSAMNWLEVAVGYYNIVGNDFRVLGGTYNASNTIVRTADYCTIAGNHFDSLNSATTGRGVYSNAGSTVSGNAFYGCRVSIYLAGSRSSAAGNAIRISNSAGVGIYASSYETISGNYIYNSSGVGTGGIGIDIRGNTTSCVGNSIEACETGIQIAANLSDINVSNNSITNFTYTIVNGGITNGNIVANTGASAVTEIQTVRMKNTSGATINAGNVVTFKSVAAGDEITTTTTAGDNKVYGVATASILNNAYGYIQILGKTTLLTVDGTTDIAVGDLLTTFTTVGIAAKAAAGNTVFAIALEAYIADNSNGVIDALIINPRLI